MSRSVAEPLAQEKNGSIEVHMNKRNHRRVEHSQRPRWMGILDFIARMIHLIPREQQRPIYTYINSFLGKIICCDYVNYSFQGL